MSSWSSLECSPACHAGDRGFKSHRGRFHSTVRKPGKRRSSNLRDCEFDSHPCYLIGSCSSWLPVQQSSQNKRGGRREVQVLHDPLTMARSSNGRMRDPHSRDAGSIPARVTNNSQVLELGSTRRSERRALCGMGVRISPWLLTRVSQCSVRPHKPCLSGAIPEPAMTRYANWKSGEVESLVFVGASAAAER